MMYSSRLLFAAKYAVRHLIVSLAIAFISAIFVFGFWYAPPWGKMQNIGNIYLLVLAVDVICGPLLTLILSSPKKSFRERWLDLSLVGFLQLTALVYGVHSVWVARPVALVFEVDRMVLITANELNVDALALAPEGLRELPWMGNLLQATTRKPKDGAEMVRSVEQGLVGVSIAEQPNWWLPLSDGSQAMRERAKPLNELITRRPQDALALVAAAQRSGLGVQELSYLPLVSSKTLDWIALLNSEMKMVGYAKVEGFE